ncbi:MAG: hypothetical protein ACYTGL_00500 [Planctomycetota bacterium]|jgi:hypothetical protein
MNRITFSILLASLALFAATPAFAQDQFFPGAPPSPSIFNPLAGTQPAPPAPGQTQADRNSGVWQIPSPQIVPSPAPSAGMLPQPGGPQLGPPVSPMPGQYPPGTLVDLRTGLPINIANGQPIDSAQQQPAANSRDQVVPQQTPLPRVSPAARRFWRGVRGYGRSEFGQSRAGYSNFGQSLSGQNQSGYSRHNQSLRGQSFPSRGFRNQSRFNQSLRGTTLHNVVVPYGRNWR